MARNFKSETNSITFPFLGKEYEVASGCKAKYGANTFPLFVVVVVVVVVEISDEFIQ
jgi:hypothetical protein